MISEIRTMIEAEESKKPNGEDSVAGGENKLPPIVKGNMNSTNMYSPLEMTDKLIMPESASYDS